MATVCNDQRSLPTNLSMNLCQESMPKKTEVQLASCAVLNSITFHTRHISVTSSALTTSLSKSRTSMAANPLALLLALHLPLTLFFLSRLSVCHPHPVSLASLSVCFHLREESWVSPFGPTTQTVLPSTCFRLHAPVL